MAKPTTGSKNGEENKSINAPQCNTQSLSSNSYQLHLSGFFKTKQLKHNQAKQNPYPNYTLVGNVDCKLTNENNGSELSVNLRVSNENLYISINNKLREPTLKSDLKVCDSKREKYFVKLAIKEAYNAFNIAQNNENKEPNGQLLKLNQNFTFMKRASSHRENVSCNSNKRSKKLIKSNSFSF